MRWRAGREHKGPSSISGSGCQLGTVFFLFVHIFGVSTGSLFINHSFERSLSFSPGSVFTNHPHSLSFPPPPKKKKKKKKKKNLEYKTKKYSEEWLVNTDSDFF